MESLLSGCLAMLIPLIITGIFVTIAVVFIIYSVKKKKGYLQELSLTFENAELGGFAPVFLGGIYKGKRVRVELYSGGENSPPCIHLKLFTDTPFSLTIYTEGMLQKLGKHMGLVKEVETGIPGFDEKFVIKSDNAGRTKEYLMSEVNRRIVESIIKTGFTGIDIKNGIILVVKSSYNMSSETKPSFIHPVLDGLIVMSQSF